MRKLLMFVALVLGMVSCQNYLDDFDVNVGGEKEVVVSVSLPESTRANSAVGAISNEVVESDEYTLRYIFQIWDEAKQQKKDAVVEYSDDTTISFPVRLVPGRNYRFVVWADVVRESDKTDLHYNTTNFPTISVNTDSWVAMDETRDAYTTSELITDFGSAQNYTLTLKRPFAKLRVITTDMDELMGVVPTTATVTYTTEHYNTFNALDSKAVRESKNENKEHKDYTIKEYELTNGKVLFTDYFFAENDAVSFNLSVNMSDNGEPITRNFNTDIPVNRNHLTTLIGNILTEGDNIEVRIEEGFDGEIEYTYINRTKPANNEIWYTSTDGKVVTPYDGNAFGAKIISNTYEQDMGVITFDGDVTKVGSYAFYYRNGLKHVTLPNSLNVISHHAFGYCKSLEEINIPNSVTEIEESAFYGANKIKAFYGKFASEDNKCLIVNNTLNKFACGCEMNEYIIPNGVERIANGAFRENLVSNTIYIPNTVKTIGYDAFWGSKTLQNITIPDSVSEIGGYCFAGCEKLTNVVLGSGITRIEKYLFQNCSSLSGIDIPSNVQTIGQMAFYGCYSMRNISIPSSVTSIESYAFEPYSKSGGYAVRTLYIEDLSSWCKINFTDEGSCVHARYLYINNELVKNITIPSDISAIKQYTFAYIGSIESITIPDTVKEISRYAFYRNQGVKEIVVKADIPTIGFYCFGYCTSLENVILQGNIDSISMCAFYYCNKMKSITLPESVTAIGDSAFFDCRSLESVYCKATTPPSLGSNAFKYYDYYYRNIGCSIYVPTESVDAYKSADGWNGYADNIIGYDFQ